MATLDEAAQQLQISKATLRRWIKSGSIEAYLDKHGPHGPQWHIPDGAIVRRLHPDQPIVEVLSPDNLHPMQTITVIKDTMIKVEETVEQLTRNQEHIAESMIGMHQELLAEVRQLQHHVAQLEAHPRHSWWPWKR